VKLRYRKIRWDFVESDKEARVRQGDESGDRGKEQKQPLSSLSNPAISMAPRIHIQHRLGDHPIPSVRLNGIGPEGVDSVIRKSLRRQLASQETRHAQQAGAAQHQRAGLGSSRNGPN